MNTSPDYSVIAPPVQTGEMIAFHGDSQIKAQYLEQLHRHHQADKIIQGTGYKNGRGCAVGCTLKNYDHAQYPIQLGLPTWLARLEDRIFEEIPQADAPQFAVDFLEKVPVGTPESVMTDIRHQLAIYRLTPMHDHYQGGSEYQQVSAALNQVIELHRQRCDDQAKWSAAESAARLATWSAAESAARLATWSNEQRHLLGLFDAIKRDENGIYTPQVA